MSVRLDKWLKVARIFKTRSQAQDACAAGRVEINQNPAKAHRTLNIGDRITVQQQEWRRIFIVRELRDKPVSKAEAARLYEDLSPPRPALDPLQRLMRRPPAPREKGAGRPTKKDRRRIEKLTD